MYGSDISNDDGTLLNESYEARRKTGLTPRQLASRCAALETALRLCVTEMEAHSDSPYCELKLDADARNTVKTAQALLSGAAPPAPLPNVN